MTVQHVAYSLNLACKEPLYSVTCTQFLFAEKLALLRL